MAKPKICAGCNQPIKGTVFDWQSVANGTTRPYCIDCDDKLIQGAPLPRDEAWRDAASAFGRMGGSVSSPAKTEAARRNAQSAGRKATKKPALARLQKLREKGLTWAAIGVTLDIDPAYAYRLWRAGEKKE